jgi:hypothetical protein
MEVSGQRQAQPELYPRGRTPSLSTGMEAGWASEPVWTQRKEEKSSCLCRRSKLDSVRCQTPY